MCADDSQKSFTISGLVGNSWKAIETWYANDTLKKREAFRDAETATLSRWLPPNIQLVHFINDSPRSDHYPTQIEFEVVSGNIAYREGERFRLSPQTASHIYQKAAPTVT